MIQRIRFVAVFGGLSAVVVVIASSFLAFHKSERSISRPPVSSADPVRPPVQQIIPLVTFDSAETSVNPKTHSAPALVQFGDSSKELIFSPDRSRHVNLPLIQDLGGGEPEVEKRRQATEVIGSTPSSIRITSGFECSRQATIRTFSSTHYRMAVAKTQAFVFRVDGAKGKTIRFDLVDPQSLDSTIRSIKPLISYAENLSDSSTYHYEPHIASDLSSPPFEWNFIDDSWSPDSKTLCFTLTFETDHAFIALRVPRPPSYNEKFFESMRKNGHVEVVTVGCTPGGRDLLLARIGDSPIDGEQIKPTILIYAGEHADEPDGMWVAEGAITFLTSDNPLAKRIRNEATFLIIPCLDPDTSVLADHAGILLRFDPSNRLPENVMYCRWFQEWVAQGKRLDLAISLHNGPIASGNTMGCFLLEGSGKRGELARDYNACLLRNVEQAGYSLDRKPWNFGWAVTRLSGWLSHQYGPLSATYEFNCQSPRKRLKVADLAYLGEVVANSSAEFVTGKEAKPLKALFDDRSQYHGDDFNSKENVVP
jgi:hypothetical protein